MGCKEIRKKLSLYLDDQLGERDTKIIEVHLAECPNCMKFYRDIKGIKDYCNNLGEKEIPLGFYDRLVKELHKKGEVEVLRKKRKISIAIGLVAVLMVIVVSVSMVSSLMSGNNEDDLVYDKTDTAGRTESAASEEGIYEVDKGVNKESMREEPDSDADIESKENSEWENTTSSDGQYDGDEGQTSSVDRKIIKSAYLGIETLEFEVMTNNLEGKVNLIGGYIESSDIEGISRKDRGNNSPTRRAHYEIRIPSKKFEQFINEVDGLGNLITKEIGGEDVTSQYFDTQARIKSLTIQEDRLLSILEKAERLQDIIELESELSRVRYEIENYTGTLKRLDNMVNYSQVSLDVYEVKEIKDTEPDPETLGERIVQAFKESLKNLREFFENVTVFLVAALPYLVIIIPLLWIIWMLISKLMKSKVKEKEEEDE